jgi:cytochrome c biogenesis protein CcdA/thiol-disulfide isomerase/thioredoxin
MNVVEAGLAFAEGLALIASPCILPVLPLVLSASVEGGRKRPFGIIIGFVLSFTFFALASRKLVEAFHINLDIIKNGSLVFLLLFGLVLLSEKLSAKFSQATQGAANLGSSFSANGKGGLLSGVVIGALIGFVWTPCAGPILAAVLVQVIRQQSDSAGSVIITAFAIGAGVPMLIIALLGRRVMSKLGFFTRHAEAVRKSFGIIIILSVLFIASGIDVQKLAGTATPSHAGEKHWLDKPYPAPEFAGIDGWINSAPLKMSELRGKVVLVDFWTYSCINCVRTLPYITAWDAKYRDKGLVIIGVSAPEFEFEKNIDNVKAAVLKDGIHYPVALDNHLATWTNFANKYWPAHYLIDKAGRVVYLHYGEGDYDVTENAIRSLLGMNDKTQDNYTLEKFDADETRETYLGYARASGFSSNEIMHHDVVASYSLPEQVQKHGWALNGQWKIEPQKITAEEAGASLHLHFKARKVFLVMGSATGKAIPVTLRLNGKPPGQYAGKDVPEGKVSVTLNTIYELVDLKQLGEGEIEIKPDGPGLEAYAFTFGG